MTGCAIPRARRPCDECPWRTDSDPGQFSLERFEALRATSGGPGAEAQFGAPVFACHKSAEGREIACAGWLATAGADHLGMRLAVCLDRLDAAALVPGEDWPQLYGSYAEMFAAKNAHMDKQ